MRSTRPWTVREDERLRRDYAALGGAALARQLGRSLRGVHHRADRLGLGSADRRRWSPAEDEQLQAEYSARTSAALGADLGRSAESVQHRARRLGLAAPVHYSTEEAEWVRRHYATTTSARLALEMGRRSVMGVHRHARRAGLAKSRRWTAAEEERVQREYRRRPTPALAAELGRTPKEVRDKAGWLRRNRLSPEALALLGEMREVGGVVELFAERFGVGRGVVERALAARGGSAGTWSLLAPSPFPQDLQA